MKRIASLLLLSAALAGSARAALIEYTFSGTFTDAATVSGSFTLDTGSGPPFLQNLAVTAGPGFTARSYAVVNSTVSAFLLGALTQPTFLFIATDEANRALRITPTGVLDGSVLSVPLDTGDSNNGAVECFNCSPARILSSGSFALAVPNYATVLLTLSPTSVQVGDTVTATAAVTGLAPLGTPTGTVDVLGSGALCSITLPATSCTFTATDAGSTSLLAQYNGNANYRIVLSNLAPLDVRASTVPVPVPGPGGALVVLLAALVALAAWLGRRR